MPLPEAVFNALQTAVQEYARADAFMRVMKTWHIVVHSEDQKKDAQQVLRKLRSQAKQPAGWFSGKNAEFLTALTSIADLQPRVTRAMNPRGARILIHVQDQKDLGRYRFQGFVSPLYPPEISTAIMHAFEERPETSWIIVVHTALQQTLAKWEVKERTRERGDYRCPAEGCLTFVIDPSCRIGSIEKRRGKVE